MEDNTNTGMAATKDDSKIVYSCVVRGSTILCSYQTDSTEGSFEREVKVVLDLLAPARKVKISGRHIFTASRHRFYCLFRRGLVYMVASEPDSDKKQHFVFLHQMKKQFLNAGLMSKVSGANEQSLNANFRNQLINLTLKFYRVGPSLGTLQADLNEVKTAIGQNFDKMMERGENLDYLTTKAKTLESAAKSFQVTGNQLTKKNCCFFHRCRICAIITAVLVTIIILIITLWFTGVIGDDPPAPMLLGRPPPPPPQTVLAPSQAGGGGGN